MEHLNPAHPSHSNHIISTKGRKAQRVWYPEEPLFEATVNELKLDWNREPFEQCGFIDSNQDIWYVPNIHQHPTHNFLMETEECERIFNYIFGRGDNIIGVFHTHPNNVPWPSPRDIVGWPNPLLGWRYFIVTSNEVLEWELIDG